jgi:hypothetical protein
MTGIRPWTAEVTAFGVVVRIEHDLIHCPLVLDAQYLLHCCDRQHDRPDEARLPMMRVERIDKSSSAMF